MGKFVKFFLLPCTLVALLFFLFVHFTTETWVYDLPNGYKVRKLSNQNVVLGVEIDGDFYTQYKNEEVGIESYVAEFQENSQYVGVKTLCVDEDETSILFYLIDTKERKIRGPYSDEASYLAASGVWTSESFGSWITTSETPEGAYFK